MDDKYKDALFMQLVLGLQGSAWVMLGKVQNPVSGKAEVNLDQAKVTIDTIEVLKEKCTLGEEEGKLIEGILTQLRVNYVEVANKDQKKEEQKEPGKEEPKEKNGESKDKDTGSGKRD